ncbi:MAG: histidine kinase [Candidatus Nanopelagicaceae bacterium]|jgi:two-component sensor histidine kinase|nr:histidine kinase [Candidatus Nanopelagicaceae bacterium]
MPFRHLVAGSTSLSEADVARLGELVAEWQLLADISFADLVLWVPRRTSEKSWPEGHLAIAQIRPMTAATVFTQDVIGDEVHWGARVHIDHALSTGEIVRDTQPEQVGELRIKEETIPVFFQGRVIAVISRHRNIETMRTPSRLELNYREIANHIYRMIAEGSFPVKDSVYLAEAAPRVGDGLVRLNVDGEVMFASPNARSAFSRLGWERDLEGHNLGDVLDFLARKSEGLTPREENWRVSMSGRTLRRDEFENANGVVDFLAIPLTEGENRIGAVVLVHNVTELRRKDRALISKDATIREIHHRVKNNLQTVSALLRLQSRRIEDPNASAAIEEAVRRVASIALVHETLSTSAQDSVQFDEVISKIIQSAVELSTRPNEITISKEGEFGAIPSLVATPLALVITELVHNALEHGVSETGSVVRVSVTREGSMMTASVIDDGTGIPSDFSLEKNTNLGLQIVHTLTLNELAGEIEFIKPSTGTEVRITFPISR